MAHRLEGSVCCPLRLTVSYLATSETETFRPTYYTLDHRRHVALVLLWDGLSLRGLVEAQILDPDGGAPDGRTVERPRVWEQTAEALVDLARSARGEGARLTAFLERSSHGQRIARRAVPSYDDGDGDSPPSQDHRPDASTDCWDFCAGATVRYENFRKRDDLYATAIRSPADLDLDTRFMERRTMQYRSSGQADQALARDVAALGTGGLPLLSVESILAGYRLAAEMTARGWFEMGARDPSAGYDQDRLSEVLARFFGFSSPTATERRAEELRGNWEAARETTARG